MCTQWRYKLQLSAGNKFSSFRKEMLPMSSKSLYKIEQLSGLVNKTGELKQNFRKRKRSMKTYNLKLANHLHKRSEQFTWKVFVLIFYWAQCIQYSSQYWLQSFNVILKARVTGWSHKRCWLNIQGNNHKSKDLYKLGWLGGQRRRRCQQWNWCKSGAQCSHCWSARYTVLCIRRPDQTF